MTLNSSRAESNVSETQYLATNPKKTCQAEGRAQFQSHLLYILPNASPTGHRANIHVLLRAQYRLATRLTEQYGTRTLVKQDHNDCISVLHEHCL